jgi:ABC-2 type transport system ATP-binding protein
MDNRLSGPAIETFQLRKVFGEDKIAVAGLTLSVARGAVFGFLGPNGAGKTTSVKMLLGLVHPTSGSGLLLGHPVENPVARRRVGFLPEHFRFHGWMRADEFLDVHGELQGMTKADRADRIPFLLDRVRLDDAAAQLLRTFSKGMLQRVGLAMALMHRPEVVFLDEPTSGLDPFGRLLVRDIINELREAGTTVFLNSHLLSEVEVTCDRVAFIRKGTVVRSGTLGELAAGQVLVRMRVGEVTPAFVAGLSDWGTGVQAANGHEVTLYLDTEDRLPGLAEWVVGQGVQLYALEPGHVSLESLFVHIMSDKDMADEGMSDEAQVSEEEVT